MTTSALHAALRAAEPQSRRPRRRAARSSTFGELDALLDEEGDWLAAGGERFALLADNGVGWALADLALHLRQLPSVPLPGYLHAGADPARARRCRHRLRCSPTTPTRVRRVARRLARSAAVSGRTGLAMFRRQLDAATRPRLPAGTVKVTYTSGSTARAEGRLPRRRATRSSRAVAGRRDGERSASSATSACCRSPRCSRTSPASTRRCSPGATLPAAGCGRHRHELRGPDVAAPARLHLAPVEPDSLILVPELLRLLVAAAERGWPVPRTRCKFVAVGGAAGVGRAARARRRRSACRSTRATD